MPKIWGFIYLFTINGKDYVGQTIELKKRFKAHFLEKKVNCHFHNALRKYFKSGCFQIIESYHCDENEMNIILNERERYWIKKLETYDPIQTKGWNLTMGGEGQLGLRHTKESKIKMSEKHRNVSGSNNPFYGRKHTPDTLVKMRNPRSFEAVENMKKTRANVSGSNNPFYGRKHTEETREKMKLARRNRGLPI